MFDKMRVSAVILAAGSSRRFGPGDKVVELLGGRPVIVHTVRAFLDHPLVDQVVLVTGEANRERCRLLVGEDPRLLHGLLPCVGQGLELGRGGPGTQNEVVC